jgi:acyl-CoA synthetase (AMP-forming)/AMP-acid ligase II/NAD(P)-dependent dehydrogenase (short-subunit alcohol dehydrogenase family)
MASRTTTASQAEQVLLGDSRVQDTCVLGTGREAVAWVVPRRAVSTPVLQALLQERLGAEAPRVTLLDAIPRRASGEPDTEALARAGAVSPELLQRLEASLRQQGREAVALPGPRQRAETFTPLEELLPERLLPHEGPAAGGQGQVAAAAPVRPGSGRPSLLEGEPLRSPPGAPATLGETFRWTAGRHPGRTVTFIDTEGHREVLSYATLWQEGLRLWGALEARGVKAGDRVIFLLDQPAEFIRAFWACSIGGAVMVPLASPPSFDREQPGMVRLLSVWERLAHPLVLTSPRAAPALEALGVRALVLNTLGPAAPGRPGTPSATSTALLSFTSGSTGQAKGVVLSHANVLSMCDATIQAGWFPEDELSLGWLSLEHVGPLGNHLSATRVGVSHVVVARDYVAADLLRWMDLLSEFGATQSWAPNFAYGLVADRLEKGERCAWNLSRVRTLNCAGEAIVADTLQRFQALLAPAGLRPDAVCPMWGMAETSSNFSVRRGVHTCPGTPHVELGPPLPGSALRVVDEQDAVVPEGTVGHLQVRGVSVLAGYLDDDALNAQSFTPDGWLRTGDLAIVQDGQMSIAGRQKDVLIINGANVYPQEVEAVVERVPGVLPSFTVASATRAPGAQTDELVLFFVPAPEAPPLGELLRSLREHVGRALGLFVNHLVPLAAHQVPKTDLGKRGRAELRRRFEDGTLNAERRMAARYLGGSATLPPCLAVPRWVPLPQSSGGGPVASGPLLVVAPAAFAEALRAHLPGRQVLQVEPGAGESLTRLLSSEEGRRVEGVVYAVGEASGALGRARLEEEAEPVLRLVQALAPHAAAVPLRLWALAPHPESALSPGAARFLLPGLLGSAAAEVQGLEVRWLWGPGDVEGQARFLAGELLGLRPAREVAWREGQRWERTFLPWEPPRVEAPRRLKPEGLYVVTGASGGVGAAWARHLRRSLGARLLLVGRRERDAAIQALERELQAEYVPVDLTDAARLRQVLGEAEARLGRAFDGAFHFAGTLETLPLAEQTPRGLVRGAAAHVLGAVALAEAFQGRPEAVLVFASSLMGTLGAGLHAGYCAGVGFVDRFAQALAREGRHAVAVSFSAVRGLGMARALKASPPGYRALEPSQALAALTLAVEAGTAHLLAGVEGSALPWRAVGLGAGEPLEQAHVFVQQAEGQAPATFEPGIPVAVHAVDALPRRPEGTVDREALAAELSGVGQPLGPLEEVVVEAFREVLGVEGVGVNADFFALGGSSLQAQRVMLRIHERTGLRLGEAALFENPSAARLAACLQQAVQPGLLDVAHLTDEQVGLLLRVLQSSGAATLP